MIFPGRLDFDTWLTRGLDQRTTDTTASDCKPNLNRLCCVRGKLLFVHDRG